MAQLGPYSIKYTEDASPTLQTSQGNLESMHHSAGAFSETQMIYGKMIESCLLAGGRRFLIAGLGCGYIEWTLVSKILQMQLPRSEFEILSLENDPFLIDLQQQFISEPKAVPLLQEASCFFVNFEDVRHALAQFKEQNRWQIKSDWQLCEGNFQGICYDFYSSKHTPQLWSQDFLKEFLSKFSDPKNCWFATYACTGNLKRALKELGFQIQKTKGFSKKRDSTFANRFC
jgi:hypothetical protein